METLPLILDGILILIFASFIIIGRKKGFVKTVLSLAATIISIIVAKEYSPAVAQWLNDNFIHEMGVNWLTNLISDNISGGAQAVADAIPQAISEAVASLMNTSVESMIYGAATAEQIAAAAEKIYSAAEGAFILAFINAVAFLVLFIIANLILSLGVSLINTIFKLPVLKRINKLLGGIIGAVKGAIGIGVICTLLEVSSQLFVDSQMQTAVDGSLIVQFVTDLISLS